MRRLIFSLVLLCAFFAPTKAHASGAIVGTPIVCVGAPASCTYTIVSTSNVILACSITANTENLTTPTATGLTFTAISAQNQDATSGTTERCWTTQGVGTGALAFSFNSQFGDTTYAEVTEWSGTVTSSIGDGNAYAGAATGANMASGNFTTSATDIIIGFGLDGAASTPTAGTSWTKTSPTSCSCNADTRLIEEYQLDKASGTYSATATKSASSLWAIEGFGMKEPGGGGGTTMPSLTLLGVGPQ